MSACYLAPRQKVVFFQKVRSRLREKDWTWADLSRATRIPLRTVYRYRDSDTKVPRARSLNIAQALELQRPRKTELTRPLYAELRKVLRGKGTQWSVFYKASGIVFQILYCVFDGLPRLTFVKDPKSLTASVAMNSKKYARLMVTLALRPGWGYVLTGDDLVDGDKMAKVLQEGELTAWNLRLIIESMKEWLARQPKHKGKSFT